jgi:biofilm protein TabA
MIVDHVKNIQIYSGLSDAIYSGLKFISSATPDIALGTYDLAKGVKALVTEYETIEVFERGYEAHNHVIDIQYPVVGLERVKWSPISSMDVKTPYDSHRDRTFYYHPSLQGTHVDIGNGIFAIMFPEDGHSPQHYIDKPESIKKITIKVSI